MINLSRTGQSALAQWWWTIDRMIFFILMALLVCGSIMIVAASPSVASRIGLDQFYFFKRHLFMLVPSFAILFFTSILTVQQLRNLSFLVFGFFLFLTALTLFFGVEIKGATRWLYLMGFSIQPSEFLKPSFLIVSAWFFSRSYFGQSNLVRNFPILLMLCVISLLILQPDMGMSFVIFATWFAQFFIAGLALKFIIIGIILAIIGFVSAYFFIPHFSYRINKFLDPELGDNYQVEQSLDAFVQGGFFGVGPGQGTVKMYLPDAHADFIFSVIGEEFGLVWCLVIVSLFLALILRGFRKIYDQKDMFILLSVSGLLIQFGLQSLINMASSLNLIPTKGMTLPFISYGGSSLMALAYAAGSILCLTRRN